MKTQGLISGRTYTITWVLRHRTGAGMKASPFAGGTLEEGVLLSLLWAAVTIAAGETW